MSSKCIIKNCPACYNYEGKYGCEDNHDEQGRDTYCECIADCVMKQVVEKLIEADDSCYGIDCAERSGFYMCRSKLANDILKLLDIQEVE